METNYIEDGVIINKDDGTEVYPIPYNPVNKLPSEDAILEILNRYDLKIKSISKSDLEHFTKCFTHKSYVLDEFKKKIYTDDILTCSKKELGNPDNLLELQKTSYERYEYLGDAVFKLSLREYLTSRFPHEQEGFLTRLQTKLEDKNNLSQLSKTLGLGKHFIISKQIELNNGRQLDRIHEDVFEAFICALYYSQGYDICKLLIVNLIETEINISDKLYYEDNYKDKLLQFYHKKKFDNPEYNLISSFGPSHKKKFIMGLKKNGLKKKTLDREKDYLSYGIGNSKKEGEQMAAKMALISFGILSTDKYNVSDIYVPNWDELE